MTENQPRSPEYSVIIPIGPRVDVLDVLITEYDAAFASTGRSYEIIAVLDGRRGQWLDVLQKLGSSIENLRIIELSRQFGECSALAAGFDSAGHPSMVRATSVAASVEARVRMDRGYL